MMKIIFYITLFLLINSEETDYKNPMESIDKSKVDKAISTLPRRISSNLRRMSDDMKEVKKKHNLNEAETAFLIYKWITQNIAYDCYNIIYNPYAVQRNPEGVFRYGAAAGEGFSALYNELANATGLVSEKINGYIKQEDINSIGVEPNNPGHYWNLVYIDSKKYLLDTAWASGYCNYNRFFPNYKEYYFCPDPKFLIHTHYPKNSEDQLLTKNITLKEFSYLPYLSDSFFSNGFKSIAPEKALIELKEPKGTIIINSKSKDHSTVLAQLLYKMSYNYYVEIPNSCNVDNKENEITVSYLLNHPGEYYIRLYYSDPKYYTATLLTQYKIVYN